MTNHTEFRVQKIIKISVLCTPKFRVSEFSAQLKIHTLNHLRPAASAKGRRTKYLRAPLGSLILRKVTYLE